MIIGGSINIANAVALFNKPDLIKKANASHQIQGVVAISAIQVLLSAVAFGAGAFVGYVLWNIAHETKMDNISIEYITLLYTTIATIIFVLQIPGIACGVNQYNRIKKQF